jgi:polar amino acid transport system substrate-binding protein
MHSNSLQRIERSAFLLCAVCLLIVSCQKADRSWERVSDSGVLRIGLDPTFPPFEVADEQGVRGLDVDLAQAVADDLGLRTEFVYFGYDGLYDALATGQVDVLISALVVVPERTGAFAYSHSYFNAGEILVVPVGEMDEQTITGMEDLNGRTVAVELGALGHVEATTWARQLPELVVQSYGSVEEALNAVAAGESDAGLVDGVNGRLYLAQQAAEPPTEQKVLMRLPESVTIEPYALVVRIDDQMLLERLNQSLEKLTASGQVKAIVERWLGP